MTSKEFRQITGITAAQVARQYKRSDKQVRHEISRGYCILLQKSKKGQKHPLYATWRMMRTRCYDSNHKDYIYYGKRGVRVCSDWFYSFDRFVDDMYPSYRKELTLDRINPYGDYSKENCRWAPASLQQLNRRKLKFPHVTKARHRNLWMYTSKKECNKVTRVYFKSEIEAYQYGLLQFEQNELKDELERGLRFLKEKYTTVELAYILEYRKQKRDR